MILRDVHVFPVDDQVRHTTDDDQCVCGPTVEPVPRADGSMGWIIAHHSLDGREHREAPTPVLQPLIEGES